MFCNSICSDRSGMAASRFLAAAAACGILLSFAGGSRKSYWTGCMKFAIVICQQISSHFGACDFSFQIPLKK